MDRQNLRCIEQIVPKTHRILKISISSIEQIVPLSILNLKDKCVSIEHIVLYGTKKFRLELDLYAQSNLNYTICDYIAFGAICSIETHFFLRFLMFSRTIFSMPVYFVWYKLVLYYQSKMLLYMKKYCIYNKKCFYRELFKRTQLSINMEKYGNFYYFVSY